MFCLICLEINLSAQNLSVHANSICFSKDLIGDEITILDLYYYGESEMFYAEKPDTAWIKKVKKPKFGKHYSLFYTYKGIKSEYGEYYTPASTIKGRTFYIEDIIFNEREQVIDSEEGKERLNVYTIRLRDTLNNEVIFWKLVKDKFYYDLKFKIKKYNVCDKLVGEKFINYPSGEECIVKDCYYVFSNKIDNKKIYFDIEFDNSVIVNSKDAKFYLTQYEYEVKKKEDELKKKQQELKELEKEAKKGEYKMILSSLIKPKSSKFTKGALSTEGNITLYMDNYVLLSVSCEEEYFGFSLKNLSQETIKINWDNIV